MNAYDRPNQALLYSPHATPQDYADALGRLGPRQPIRTPGALATNLVAEALNQYADARAGAKQRDLANSALDVTDPGNVRVPIGKDPFGAPRYAVLSPDGGLRLDQSVDGAGGGQ